MIGTIADIQLNKKDISRVNVSFVLKLNEHGNEKRGDDHES